MTEKDLRNLQVYIGKRNQGQSDEAVIEHIHYINAKTPLSQEEWHKLLYPCCNNGMLVILKYVLEHISVVEEIHEYMHHTVYGRIPKISNDRIEVLKVLMDYLEEDKKECLSETMISAGWFGETEIVKFLIENGADRNYQTENGLDLEACAERVVKQFGDSSLKEYLVNL